GLAIKCPAPVLCPSDDRSAPNGEGRLFGLTLTLPRCKGVYPDEGNNYEHKSQCNELFHPGYFPFAFNTRSTKANVTPSARCWLLSFPHGCFQRRKSGVLPSSCCLDRCPLIAAR